MLNELAKEIHENAVEHGWYDEERSFGDIIALCHSELSEALDEYRNGKPNFYYPCENCDGDIAEDCSDCDSFFKSNQPEGIAVEMADCIIRILDWCGKENIDIDKIIKLKHEYNKTRSYKHGNKKI